MAPLTRMAGINTFVREHFSPRLTNFYSRIGLADRRRLLTNIQGLNVSDQPALLKNLAEQGVLKWHFYKELVPNAKASTRNLAHFKLSGRVDSKMLERVAEQIGENGQQIKQIRDQLLDGVYKSDSSGLAGFINRASSLAFYTAVPAAVGAYFLVAGLSFYSALFGAATFAIAAKTIQKQSQPGTVLRKLGRFNPRSRIGRLINFGSRRLFWPATLLGAGLLALAAYQYVSERFYPIYENDRVITVTSDGNRVEAEVCNKTGQACQTSELFAYQGPEAPRRAYATATALQEVIDSQDIFQGGMAIYEQEVRVGGPWRPSWLPNWIGLGSTTVLDLAGENLSAEARVARFDLFFNNLWAAGIMPTADELAEVGARRLEAQMPYNRFRDPRLQAHLELSRYYLQLDRYAEAQQAARWILNFDLTVTGHQPVFYNEAVFQLVEINRLQGMRFGSPERLSEALRLLNTHQGELQALEGGYRARYAYESLKTCVIAEQFFPVLFAAEGALSRTCQPANIAQYLENATTGQLYTPTYQDNFLAVRTLLLSGRHQALNRNFDEARREYQQVLAVIDLINDCGAVVSGETATNWQHYSPYMRDADRLVGDNLGQQAGLWSFAARCEAGRTLRGDLRFRLPVFGRAEQFDPILFHVFRAQAEQGLAEIEMERADRDLENQEGLLRLAQEHLENAYSRVQLIRHVDIFKFLTQMHEERETYYEVLVNYAEVLLDLYRLEPQTRARDLETAASLSHEVVDQRGEEDLDILYLRALFLQGDLAHINGNNAAAAATYETIINSINQAEARLPENYTLPEHYQNLREEVSIRLAVLSR